MTRILLTGATGFIGSHLTQKLLHAGHKITILARDISRIPEYLRKTCMVIRCDLVEPNTLSDLNKQVHCCKVLIHLAAKIPQHNEAPECREEMHSANVKTTQNLLKILPKTISHIIYASTLDVYGLPNSLPIKENHRTNPITNYGDSKLEAEKVLIKYCNKQKKLTILRISQVYGPGKQGIKAIPIFIKKIANGQQPTLFGDGSDLRDYVYVEDVARAFVKSVEKSIGGIFNISGGDKASIKDIVELIINISGKNIHPIYKKRNKPKIDTYFNISKARKELGFFPSVSLIEGIKLQYNEYCQVIENK